MSKKKPKLAVVIKDLHQRKRSIKRSELTKILESLGFVVRAGKSGNHYSYTHSAFTTHPGGGFNGEHSKDDLVKFGYILDAIALLKLYETELKEFLGEKDE